MQAFYINLCIGAVFAPVYIFLLPSFNLAPDKSLSHKFTGFDCIGTILSIAALVTAVMGINFGGTSYDWNSGSVITLLVVSGVLFLLFGLQQYACFMTTPNKRMFPVHFLRNREALLLFVAAAACNTAAFVSIYYIPIYFQFTDRDSALESAVRLLPLIFLLSGTILLNGFLMSKFGYYQPWYMIGAALTLVATVLLCKFFHIYSISSYNEA